MAVNATPGFNLIPSAERVALANKLYYGLRFHESVSS